MLGLQVVDVREGAQRQERPVQIAVGLLDLALGLGIAGAKRHDLGPELPEERRDLVVQDRLASSTAGNDRGVVVADDLVGHAAETLEAPEHRREQVPDRAAERKHRRVGGRVRKRGHQAEGLTGCALADRDLSACVPPVDLGDLAGQIARPLERPRRKELGRPWCPSTFAEVATRAGSRS